MKFEGLICPNCSSQLNEDDIRSHQLQCPHCKIDLKDKKFIAFLEYLIMSGLVTEIDFFDQKVYADEIEHITIEEKE